MKDNLARLLFTDEGPVVGVDPIMAVEFHACFSRFICHTNNKKAQDNNRQYNGIDSKSNEKLYWRNFNVFFEKA